MVNPIIIYVSIALVVLLLVIWYITQGAKYRKERWKSRALGGIMLITGLFIWFFSDSELPMIKNAINGVGIFLFIVGIINVRKRKNWSEMSDKEKKWQMAILAILAIAILTGVIILIWK